MKAYRIVALIACLAPLSGCSTASVNIIGNGDFSAGLTDWTFNDISYKGGDSWPNPYSEAYVEAEEAVIHGHYAYGHGELRQEFSAISPSAFSFAWDFDGECGPFYVRLLSGKNVALEFLTHRDALLPWPGPGSGGNRTDVSVAGVTNRIEGPPNYLGNGTCQVLFDHTSLQVKFTIQSDRGGRSVVLPLPEDFSVNTVVLGIRNNGYDGRNDAYAHFDNVVLIPNR